MAINEILSSVQINTTLAKYCVFKGAYPADRVPLMERSKNQAFIINTDTNDKPGSHWTALFIKSGECTFFDPFGSECMNVFLLKQLRNIGLKNINTMRNKCNLSRITIVGIFVFHLSYI